MNNEEQQSDYSKYRGKCVEYVERAIKDDPTLKRVNGKYYDPMWGRDDDHCWCVRPDGSIYDPTRLQYPSAGAGIYTPHPGYHMCEECGKQVDDADVQWQGHYPVCSGACAMKLVGL